MNVASVIVAVLIGFAVASSNTTSSMNVPKAQTTVSRNIDQPPSQQASFALSRVLANLKRGTIVGHFPGGGVDGVEGYGCNARMQGNATLEWGAGSSELGNWSSELGEIFFEVMSQKGLNIAGDPTELFDQRDAARSAEYFIGARISQLNSNYCQPVSFWDGTPQNEYSGETYIKVEWTVFFDSSSKGNFKDNDGRILQVSSTKTRRNCAPVSKRFCRCCRKSYFFRGVY